MKVLLYAKNQEAYTAMRISEELAALKCDWMKSSDLKDLEGFTHCIIRESGLDYQDKDIPLLEKLEQANILLSHSTGSLQSFRDKWRQSEFFSNGGFQQIPTSMACDFRLIPKDQDYIIKPLRGNGGRGILQVKASEIQEKIENLGDPHYLIQPYFNFENEYRIFFSQKKIHFIIEKKKNRNGFHNFDGNNFKIIEKLPNEGISEVKRFIRESQLSHGAIDIFFYESKLYFLEVNLFPGVRSVETLSGENITRDLLELFLQKQ